MPIEKPKESVHISLDKQLYIRLENMRKTNHSEMLLPRSSIYEETLFFGEKIQNIKKELGEKDFSRIWHWLNKLNLKTVDIEKIL